MLSAKALASFTARPSGRSRTGRSRRRPSLVHVGVDADGQDVQLRLRLVRRARELDGGARRQRGQQIAGVVGDHLDDVVAGIERQLLGDGVGWTAARWPSGNRGRDAVDAPFDAADALASVLDARRYRDEIAVSACRARRRRNRNGRRRAAVDDLLQVDDLGRVPAPRRSGSPASASRTRSGLNSDWCTWPMVVTSRPRTRCTKLSRSPLKSKKPAGVRASQSPSGLSISRRTSRPSATDQKRIVPSEAPEIALRPSGENATLLTSVKCPSKLRSRRPVAASQSLRVLSSPPESTL